MAIELAPIRINALAPGVIDSGALDKLGDRKDAVVAEVSSRNPVGRIGTADEIVSAAMLLLSNTYMTGTVLHVDGGGSIA